MTLGCRNCNKDMGPSEELPGREGTMVYPVLVSLAYIPSKEWAPSYKTEYMISPVNISLCFECIEKALPGERKETMQKVYKAFKLETIFNKRDEKRENLGLSGNELKVWSDASEKFTESLNNLEKGCIFCGQDIKNGKPYFIAKAINRAYSEKHMSGIFFPFGNYSWSNMKVGTTSINICFDDFRKHFYNNFESLSYMLTGERKPNTKVKPSELHISPEFERALEEQSGKSIDDFLNEEIQKGNLDNIRIIRREKN